MADWDDDTPRLRSNLAKVLERVRDEAFRREPLTIEIARGWQLDLMQSLIPPDPALVGRSRGEAGLENYDVKRRRGSDARRLESHLLSLPPDVHRVPARVA